MTDDLTPGNDQPHPSSMLRHDLVAPLNQILGYAELLIFDAEDQGLSSRSASLRAIQDQGRRALGSIDALIGEPEPGRFPDLAALLEDLVGPSDAILGTCGALEEASAEAPDREAFLEDIGRVREAAVQMVELARRALDEGAGRVG